MQLCDTFGLPLVSLADTPGMMVGPKAEAIGKWDPTFLELIALHEVTAELELGLRSAASWQRHGGPRGAVKRRVP